MRVETIFKLYTMTFASLGCLRAIRRYERPDTVAALTLAAPILWPIHLAIDAHEYQSGWREEGLSVKFRRVGHDQTGDPHI